MVSKLSLHCKKCGVLNTPNVLHTNGVHPIEVYRAHSFHNECVRDANFVAHKCCKCVAHTTSDERAHVQKQ